MIRYQDGLSRTLGKLFIGLCLLASAFAAVGVAQRGATYTNPVQGGDFPDPSVIRVGRDFYATATSSEWGPEFPIMHSRDLVNWEIVSVVFPKPPEWSVGNYWAPEIWQENGKFYIFYVGRRKGGNLCIAAATADKPIGPYQDHGPLKCQEVGSIDAFPIRDENGRLFVVWKEDGNSVGKPTPIWAQELDTTNWKLVGEQHELIRNDPTTWEGTLVEGPFIMRKNGYFYLFYSGNFCCGRGCNYAVGVARSKTLLGGWEKYSENPILKGNENWNCPGHGTAVTNENGRTYFMYHAYDPKDTNYVGRQALLDEVTWTADGWARINNGKGPSKQAASPLGVTERDEEYTFFDDFNRPELRAGWQWMQNSIPRYRINGGFVELSPNENSEKDPIGGILAYWTTRGDYIATTMIDAASVKNGELAGISAYGDNDNALGAGVQNGEVVVWRREKGKFNKLWSSAVPRSGQIFLRMTARDGVFYDFAVSPDGRNFRNVGFEQNGDYLPPWDRGVRVALTVGGVNGASARFGSLSIEAKR